MQYSISVWYHGSSVQVVWKVFPFLKVIALHSQSIILAHKKKKKKIGMRASKTILELLGIYAPFR